LSSKEIRGLGLIHNDVITPGFSELFFESYQDDGEFIVSMADNTLELLFDFPGRIIIDLKQFRDRKDLKYWSPKKPGLAPAKWVEGRIPWHFDFQSGIGIEPNTFYSDISLNENLPMNIDQALSLSRCTHFVTLGQAYRLTQDEKYTQAFANHLDDWIQQNPPKYGLHWAFLDEVSIRACNWALAWDFFKDSPALTDRIKDLFSEALWEHGDHIFRYRNYPSDSPLPSRLLKMLSLVYLGLVLSKKRWVESSLRHLKTLEPWFQNLSVWENLLFFSLAMARSKKESTGEGETLLKKLEEGTGSAYVDALKKFLIQMQKWALHSDVQSDSLDRQSVPLHSLRGLKKWDLPGLNNIGALLLMDTQLKGEEWIPTSDLVWLFGFDRLRSFRSLPGAKGD